MKRGFLLNGSGSHSPGGREKSDSAFSSCCWSLAFAKSGVTDLPPPPLFFPSSSSPFPPPFFPGWVAALCTWQKRGLNLWWKKGWREGPAWVLVSKELVEGHTTLLGAISTSFQSVKYWLLPLTRERPTLVCWASSSGCFLHPKKAKKGGDIPRSEVIGPCWVNVWVYFGLPNKRPSSLEMVLNCCNEKQGVKTLPVEDNRYCRSWKNMGWWTEAPWMFQPICLVSFCVLIMDFMKRLIFFF